MLLGCRRRCRLVGHFLQLARISLGTIRCFGGQSKPQSGSFCPLGLLDIFNDREITIRTQCAAPAQATTDNLAWNLLTKENDPG